jgi:dTDP-L-rhamnose 4-epimerase
VIDVILPVRNEAGALPWVLARMPPGHRPLVVDNGSTDGSARVAADLGAEVVSEPVAGFGAACHTGLLAARTELVAFMDCDASLDPAELPAVTAPVASGVSDLVMGARVADPGAWPAHARLANRLLAARMRRRTGAGLTDLGPMRSARRDALIELGIRDRRFGWPLEMVLRAGLAGWRISEVPVGYRQRVGRSKVTGSVRGTALAVLDMSRVRA